ncbi:hypothetical protein B0H10DRAFT_831230 [Mycena sp. CBHHK59/15]|nr:hypothetical protein B0H10DRAFT_831230 [Mycena sp. CBHHK59/15]
MTTTILIKSPAKATRTIVVANDPTIRKIRNTMVFLEADTSWDVANLEASEEGYEATRPRPELRPAARKARLGVVEDELERMRKLSARQIRAIIALQEKSIQNTEAHIQAAEINERHEATDRCLRELVFNDIVFDTNRPQSGGVRVLNWHRKRKLKDYGLGYITRLLDPTSCLPPNKLPLRTDIATIRTWTLGILTPQQQVLCYSLLTQLRAGWDARNVQQHPAPDTDTALEMTREAAGVHFALLEATLRSNPKRIKFQDEPADTNLDLFSPPGKYVPVLRQRAALEAEKRQKEEMEQDLAEIEAYGI